MIGSTTGPARQSPEIGPNAAWLRISRLPGKLGDMSDAIHLLDAADAGDRWVADPPTGTFSPFFWPLAAGRVAWMGDRLAEFVAAGRGVAP